MAKQIPYCLKNLIAFFVFWSVVLVVMLPLWSAYQKSVPDLSNGFVKEPNLNLAAEVVGNTSDYVNIYCKLSSVDFGTGTYKLHIEFNPSDSLTDGLLSLTKPITMFWTASIFNFPAGKPMASQDLTVVFENGDITRYPVDKWTSDINVYTVYTNESLPLLVTLNVWGALQTLDFEVDYTKSLDPALNVTDITLNHPTFIAGVLTVRRSASTIAFSIFIIIAMWLLTIGVAASTYQFLFLGREVVPPNLAASAAILFAISNVRNAQPQVPAVGTVADVVGYFWNVVIIALSVFMMSIIYVVRWRPPTPKPKEEV